MYCPGATDTVVMLITSTRVEGGCEKVWVEKLLVGVFLTGISRYVLRPNPQLRVFVADIESKKMLLIRC